MKRDTKRSVLRAYVESADGFTSIQAATTFAVAGIVGALVVAPLMAPNGQAVVATLPGAGIDMTSTGSIAPSAGTPKQTYRLRRSVLQQKGARPCVLFDSGRREGDC